MPADITIKFTPSAEALLARYDALPSRVPLAMAAAMDRQNQLTIAYTTKTYLSFPRNQPPVLNGLRVITNRLRGSIRATKTVINGQSISSTIGSNVRYAAVHEFGGTFTVQRKGGIVRLKTDSVGNLLRQGPNGQLAIFARKKSKRAKEVQFGPHTYTVTYPERMPIRRGIADQSGAYTDAISAAVVKELNG